MGRGRRRGGGRVALRRGGLTPAAVTLVRHATLVVELDGLRLLVDPMLDPAGARGPVANTPNARDNPLVSLPPDAADLLRDIDAVLVTHLHVDHFDDGAVAALDPEILVLCQPGDAGAIRGRGFTNVRPVEAAARVGPGVTAHRTGGRHGHGPLADKLGPVSGFVIEGSRSIYVAGDTVWCEEVAAALAEHEPDTVVLNAGGARFLAGDAITMEAADVVSVARASPAAALVAVHMEAVNHCLLTRAGLARELGESGVRAAIPADGERLEIGAMLGAAGPDSSAG